MFTADTFLFLLALLLVSFCLEPIANKARIPFSIVLVLIGFIGSEITVKVFDIDTGIRWGNFKDIIFYVLLPVLIFQAALVINLKTLLKNLLPILLMALPLMIISALVTALALFKGINHPVGFPWIAALIAGALLSATDPAAVLALLKQANAPERLNILLEGESLFNDATAIVLFSILIALATNSQDISSVTMLFLRFSEVFFGGLFAGVVFGFIAHLLINLLDKHGFVPISILCAYAVFIVAEDILHFSGVIAVLAAGVTMSTLAQSRLTECKFFGQFWQLLSKFAESMIFLLAGITITLMMFVDQWLAILIGIVAVLFSRITVIFGFFPLISLLPGIEPISLKDQTILTWGGVRGTVTLALALSLPLTLDYWYTIQSIAYGVVIFTLFFQTMTMPFLLKSGK